jgi:hypothetical protein
MKKSLLFTFLIVSAAMVHAQLQAPTLVSPADSSENLNTTITFNWNPALGGSVTGYELEIDDDMNFGSPAPASILGTTGMGANLLFGTRYYWRVRAIAVGGGFSPWSDTLEFTTYDSLIALTAPTDSSTASSAEVTLTWNSNGDFSNYQYQLDTTATFNSTELTSGPVTNPKNANNIVTTKVRDLYFNQLYFWRVRAVNANDTSKWSVAWRFITPKSVFPQNIDQNAVGIAPDTAVRAFAMAGVEDYIFELDSNMVIDAGSKEYDNAILQTPVFSLNQLLFGTTYYWRVKGRNANDESDWSDTWSFTVASTIAMESPDDGATVSQQPDLRWTQLPGVTTYQYQVDDNAGFTSPTTGTILDDGHVVLSKLQLGQYFWRIRGIHSRDTSDWSAARSFTASTVGIEANEHNDVVQVYPNPATSELFVTLPESASGQVTLAILDLSGKTLYTTTVNTGVQNNVHRFELGELATGAYLLNVRSSQLNYQQKLLISK